MSTSPPPAAPAPHIAQPDSIRLYGHSSLFYWWPIWVLGFIFAMWSWIEGTRAIQVPSGTVVSTVNETTGEYKLTNSGAADKMKSRLEKYTTSEKDKQRNQPRVSHEAWMGATFCMMMLLVISITNVPLRGLWSVVVIVTVIALAVIFALAGWWDEIFHALGGLHIYIGMAGYLFFATVLFIMWLVSMLVFDRQIYITFEPSLMRVCEEVGSGEKSYDTMGMSIEKHRDDIFRHWVLGLGSGDLTIRTSGATPHQFTLSNVLFLSSKLNRIEQMQREKQIRVDEG